MEDPAKCCTRWRVTESAAAKKGLDTRLGISYYNVKARTEKWKRAIHWDASYNAVREEKESKIALIFIITSRLKIECSFKFIVFNIYFKKSRPIPWYQGKKWQFFKVCLLGLQWSRTMFCPSPLSKIRNDLEFFSTWWPHFQLIKFKYRLLTFFLYSIFLAGRLYESCILACILVRLFAIPCSPM